MASMADMEIYLNDISAKKNDICKILGVPELEFKKDEQTKKTYPVLHCTVTINGSERTWDYTPNKAAREKMAEKWGKEFTGWDQKSFQIDFVKTSAFGKTTNAIDPIIL